MPSRYFIVRSAFVAAVFATLLAAQETATSKTDTGGAAAIANELFKMHEAWGPAMNSPNASVHLKEMLRSGQTIRYRIYASGLPRNEVYTLVQWPVTSRGPVEILSGVTLDETGLAVCAGKPGTCGDPQQPNDPIDVPIVPAKGEPFRFGLISGETLKAFSKIVPAPIEAKDKACRLEAVLLMPNAEAVVVEASGYRPGQRLEFASSSEGENHHWTVQADAAGGYKSTLLPFVRGKPHGTMHVTVQSADCSPSVDFDWGRK